MTRRRGIATAITIAVLTAATIVLLLLNGPVDQPPTQTPAQAARPLVETHNQPRERQPRNYKENLAHSRRSISSPTRRQAVLRYANRQCRWTYENLQKVQSRLARLSVGAARRNAAALAKQAGKYQARETARQLGLGQICKVRSIRLLRTHAVVDATVSPTRFDEEITPGGHKVRYRASLRRVGNRWILSRYEQQ